MTALSIDCSTRDKEYGWADVKPTHHPLDPIKIYALQAWKYVSLMVDDQADQSDIDEMINTAQELEAMARDGTDCTCNPRTDCRLCAAIARMIYADQRERG